MSSKVLDAVAIGVLARRVLTRPHQASVIAAFERSLYLDLGDALIAVGTSGLHDGPLTVRLGQPVINSDIETGQRWTTTPDHLRRDDGLTIDLTKARLWQPNIPTSPPDRSRLRQGVDHLLGLLREKDRPGQGLIDLVITDRSPGNTVERAARPRIDALRKNIPRWLDGDPIDPTPAIGLLGLGPGLTPAGDDLIGGLLMTCRHLGEIRTAEQLGKAVNTAAATATNRISQSHLAAAAEGYGAAPLHDILHAMLITGQRSPRGTLDAVAKIGHSSGFDALAGMVLAATAWLQAGKAPKTA